MCVPLSDVELTQGLGRCRYYVQARSSRLSFGKVQGRHFYFVSLVL